MATKIEWVKNADGSTGETWNPLAGCKEISPGCTNCYAATMAHRLEAMGQEKYKGTTRKLPNGKVVWTGLIQMAEHTDNDFTKPLRKKKPTMYFVNSMSDLFHQDVPFEFVDKVFDVMAICKRHTFQVLTKRPERMAEYLRSPGVIDRVAMSFPCGIQWPLPNVWLGTSVEDQQRANERIPWLLSCPAAVHFLSCEPLLGPVVFKDEWLPHKFSREPGCDHCETCVGRLHWLDVRKDNHGPFLEWVIVGGESGPGARHMHQDWAIRLLSQCKKAGVPFFMKQMTKKAPIPDHLLVREMPK